MYMSSRANASAKARRAGGATMESNTNDINSINSDQSNTQKQAISVKQAIILLNTKVNSLTNQVNSTGINNQSNVNVELGTLEMRSSELQKKNDLLTNELNTFRSTFKSDLEKQKNSLTEVKDMILKLQSSVTDLQTTVLKLNNN